MLFFFLIIIYFCGHILYNVLNTICPIHIFDYQKLLLKCFAIYFLLHLQIYIKHIIIEHNDRKNK